MLLHRRTNFDEPLDDLALGNTGLDVIRTAAPLGVEGETARVRLQPYEIGSWIVQLV